MNTPHSQEIIKRFFTVVRMLKGSGRMRFIRDFTDRHNIRHDNFLKSEKDPASNRFQVAWIKYLAEDYDVKVEEIVLGKWAIPNVNENVNTSKTKSKKKTKSKS